MGLGSPPQVRGKQGSRASVRKPGGITPAGAGKTDKMQYHSYIGQDHPRRCGENSQDMHGIRHRWGSPPQVRGKRRKENRRRRSRRITPAGAGKTWLYGEKGNKNEDHPRRCGENAQMGRMRDVNLGSPPQVRGKLNKSCVNFRRQRITPAGAGKTDTKQFQARKK